ncbi:MAG: wax ester/triacylglycerol synthase family O-acyltransferase [Streptosporangiaceae bacterium]
MAVGGTRAERMNPVDVAWLHMDRPTNLMVVNTVLWFDAPVDQASILQVFEERVVSRFRRFRQRVADPALTLAPWAAPEWVDDADFALAGHVSRTRLPAPGDQRALQQTASDLAERPLRKDRPLWELHLLDGYGDGGALLLRTHHAIADGGALMQVLLALADPLDAGEHTGVLPVHDDSAAPPLLPGPGGRAIAAARRAGPAAGDLSAVLRAALASPRSAAELAGSVRAEAAMLGKLGFGLTADRNLLQGTLVPGKRRSWTRPVPVEAVKAAGAAAGSTVNDLMLTVITSALRRYLLEHDAPAEEVIVIVPVDLRPAGAPLPAGLGNQFGLVFVRLPTGEIDEGRRRARVKAQMDQVKSSREGVFVYTMLQRMGQLPAAVQNAWVDAFAGKATAIVTNVSGPRHRIQIAGTPVAGMMGWVPVTGPLGLGFSIVSYAGQLSVGLASDAHLLPGHDRLLARLDEEISALHTPAASSSPPEPGS